MLRALTGFLMMLFVVFVFAFQSYAGGSCPYSSGGDKTQDQDQDDQLVEQY